MGKIGNGVKLEQLIEDKDLNLSLAEALKELNEQDSYSQQFWQGVEDADFDHDNNNTANYDNKKKLGLITEGYQHGYSSYGEAIYRVAIGNMLRRNKDKVNEWIEKNHPEWTSRIN